MECAGVQPGRKGKIGKEKGQRLADREHLEARIILKEKGENRESKFRPAGKRMRKGKRKKKRQKKPNEVTEVSQVEQREEEENGDDERAYREARGTGTSRLSGATDANHQVFHQMRKAPGTYESL